MPGLLALNPGARTSHSPPPVPAGLDKPQPRPTRPGNQPLDPGLEPTSPDEERGDSKPSG
jgi:hypothetical protein